MKEKTRYLIYSLISIFFIIACILIVMFFIKNNNKVTYKDYKFYQYLQGQKYSYEGTIEFNQDKEITKLKFKDVEVELDSTPVYFDQKQEKALFPKDMAVVYFNDLSQTKKINSFSTITKQDDEYYIEDKSVKEKIENAFIFDGSDLYYFLDEVKIQVGDQTCVLSPMSYVIVRYMQYIEIYDKKTDKDYLLPIDQNDILATINDKTINLSIDAVKVKDKQQLLVKDFKFLKNFGS